MVKKIFPIPFGINWHEGMLLSQHHFQQNDERHFQVLSHQIRLLSSNHFGVCHLRIDNVALPDGLYRINEIEAVFPDGLIFSYFPKEDSGLKPLEIDAASAMNDGENEVTIYFVIAESSKNTSPILGNPPRFYSIEGELVRDDNIADNEIRIPRLFPNAFLYIGEHIPNSCIGFPLTKIVRIDGVYHIKNWTPPCFFITKNFPIWERCLKLTTDVREKATFLSDRLKNQERSTGATTGTEQILKQLLAILPSMEALVYSDNIRPYNLYKELAYALGSVSVMRPFDMIPVMKSYDHNNIDGCIYPIIALIEHYISVIDRGFSVITMNKRERFFYHYLNLNDISACRDNKMYVGVRMAKGVGNAESWMNESIIVSDFAIDNVRNKRIMGAKRFIAPDSVVSEITPGSNIILFEILLDNEFIKGEQNVHIFNPGDNAENRPTEIMLYIPRNRLRLGQI